MPMTKLILNSIAILLVLATLPAMAQQGVHFQDISLSEALELAKEENKHVFIDGYATWCGPCKRMDATTFQDSTVGVYYNDAFISVKMDMEKDEGIEVAQKYSIKAFPTFMYLDVEGAILHKAAGFIAPADFVTIAEIRNDDAQSLGALQGKFDAGNRDSIMLQHLLYQQYNLLDPHYMEVALAIANLSTDWNTDEMRAFIFQYANSAASPLFEYMVEHKKDFYNQFGEGATFGKIEKLVRDRSFEVNETTIEEMTSIFELVYPKHAKEMSSKYRLSYHRQKGDRHNYAKSAIDHYKKHPSRDAEELNEVGVTFSRVIDDQILLRKVIPLVEKSIKFEDEHYNNDTLAALFFKLGDIDKARSAAEKAIKLAKESGADSTFTKELLEVINSQAAN